MIIPLVILLLPGCGEDSALREETFRFSDQNRGWAGQDEWGSSFIMSDDNGISQSFTQSEYSAYFTKSWTSILGINTHMSHIEYAYMNYYSTFGSGFSQSLAAGIPPHGDRLYLSVGGTGFEYDLDTETITRIDSPFGYLSKIITDTGYEEDEKIGSTVKLIENLTIGNMVYNDVILFKFDDFRTQWGPYTVTEFYVSKDSGLIRFIMNSGLSSQRN